MARVERDEMELRPVKDDDRLGIVTAAQDYIESWLDGDAARMGSCLHRSLAKYEIVVDEDSGARTVETRTPFISRGDRSL